VIAIIDTATDTLAGTASDPLQAITYAHFAVDPYSPLTTSLKCVSKKRKAAAKAVLKKLTCHQKAMLRGTTVDAACLQKADDGLTTILAKLGTLCLGYPASILPLVDSCVSSGLTEALGSDPCAIASVKAIARSEVSEGACWAKEALKPGSVGACSGKDGAKLTGLLAKAGSCSAASTVPDVTQCAATLAAAIPRR
jgi:hypothetical protein